MSKGRPAGLPPPVEATAYKRRLGAEPPGLQVHGVQGGSGGLAPGSVG